MRSALSLTPAILVPTCRPTALPRPSSRLRNASVPRASAGGLRLSLNDHTIALERREVLSHGVVCDAEPFRQFFDGEALLVLEEQGEQLLLSKSE